jgi:WD40 repeat protein
MDFISSQIPPPKDWREFEQICARIFQEEWQDPYAMPLGAGGQRQHGVDILSSGPPWRGVQCKKRDFSRPTKLREKELNAIVEKAESLKPGLTLLTIATTLTKDTKLETYTRQLSERRQSEGKFEVVLLFWEDLKLLIHKHRSVLREFYQSHYTRWLATESLLELSRAKNPLDQLASLLEIYKEGPLDKGLEPFWDRSAYSFLQRIRLCPLESQRLSGPKAVCLSLSREDDWLLALGRENGSVTVRRLRVDKHVDGITGEQLWRRYHPQGLLVDLSSTDHEVFRVGPSELAGVEFLGGGVLCNVLRVRARPSQIFDFPIDGSQYDKKTWHDVSSLTLHLPDLYAYEEFVETEEVKLSESPTTSWHRSMIAVTTAGRCFKMDSEGPETADSNNPEPSVAITLAGKPIRIRRYDDYRDGKFLVVSTAQVVAIDARNSHTESIAAADKVRIQEAAILNPFAVESKRVLIGYDDGSIELIDNSHWKGWGAERLSLLDSPISLLETSETHGVFAAADQKGLVAIWSMGRISYIKASRWPIMGMALIDDCKKLITLDDDNVLALWDIVNPGNAHEITPADYSLFNLVDCYHEWLELSWHAEGLEISEPQLFGGYGRYVLGTSDDGGLCVVGRARGDVRPQAGWINSNIYGWAAHAPTMFAISVENSPDSAHALLTAQFIEPVYKCHKLWLESNGTARSASIRLPTEPVQIAVSGNGRSCVVVDGKLNVIRISTTTQGELETDVVPSPPAASWHANGFHNAVYHSSDTGHIVLVLGTEARVVDKVGSSEWNEFDWIGPGERDEIRGGHYFSANQSVLYIGLLSGGIIKIDFGKGKGIITDRFEQPANRYARFSDRTILMTIAVSDCASWIVGSGERLMYVWEASDPRPRHQVELDEPIQLARFVPGSSQFVTVSNRGECDIWDAKSGARQRRVAEGVLAAVITRDGRFLCVKVEDEFGTRSLMLPMINGRDELVEQLKKARTQVAH